MTSVFEAGWVAPGTPVVSIGSFALDCCEVPAELFDLVSAVVVDYDDSATEDAGPVIATISNSRLRAEDLISLGSAVTGSASARTGGSETVNYSVRLGASI